MCAMSTGSFAPVSFAIEANAGKASRRESAGAPAGIALRVLVRERRAHRGDHFQRGVVLGSDQLELAFLPRDLGVDRGPDFGVAPDGARGRSRAAHFFSPVSAGGAKFAGRSPV